MFGQLKIIILLIKNIKIEVKFVNTLTWNKPLYIPIPYPIDWIYSVFSVKTLAYKKDIAPILLKRTELIKFLRKFIEYKIIKIKIVSKITN